MEPGKIAVENSGHIGLKMLTIRGKYPVIDKTCHFKVELFPGLASTGVDMDNSCQTPGGQADSIISRENP